ncbi:MAG: D-alanine--D-alanine ligase [Crocinitomicaceae bacterium]|nr:D-alanine--D-alanine ligase [Crocinitomicaceae bacterium]
MKNIAILCGGFSSEFEISIKSATTILNNFPKEYNPFLIEVRQEKWVAVYEDNQYEINPWDLSFTHYDNKIRIDAALIYIHGNPGENGKIQALLEMRNIPYINSGALASELSFDKWFCNQFLKSFDIPVAKSLLLTDEKQFEEQYIIDTLGLPCFVKPSDSGSSYGISKVSQKEELQPALEKAFKEGKTVVIESFLKGTEVTCGIYQSKNGLHTLPITEIVSENDFFDFEAKYLGKSQEIIPARISQEEVEKIEAVTKKIYRLLRLRSIARIDFMLVNNEPFVIEVNTTPGFSAASIVPQMLAHEGKSITTFWREIIDFELN